MRTTALITEYLIIGFFALGILFYSYLLFMNVDDISSLRFLDNKEALLGVLTLLSAYSLGILTFRITDFFKLFLRFNLFRKMINLPADYKKKNFVARETDYYLIYQYGADNLVDKIEYNLSLVRLYRGICVLTPILGIISGWWTIKYYSTRLGIAMIVGLILVGVLSLFAHNLQLKYYESSVELSVNIIKKEISNSDKNKPK